MSTYGGGNVFTDSVVFVDVAAGGTGVLYSVPTGDYYAELSVYSLYAISLLTGGTGLDVFIEADNGSGGYARKAVADFSHSSGLAATNYTYIGLTYKLLPGERIIVQNGYAVGTARVRGQVNLFTPST